MPAWAPSPAQEVASSPPATPSASGGEQLRGGELRAEFINVERQLRNIAAERAEAEAGAALHARLREQVVALPPEKQASAQAALERVQALQKERRREEEEAAEKVRAEGVTV